MISKNLQSIITLFVIFLFSIEVFANPSDDVLGSWYNQEKDAKIEIYKKNNKYHGKIIWLKEPNENGKPKVDDDNPDPEKQSRPIMGLVIMTNFVYDDDYVWNDGNIYDPKSGKTYSCKMTLSENKKNLDVRGFIGFSLIGRTSVWTRTD
jgi:uncharacterized protein (DUF2147 family)